MWNRILDFLSSAIDACFSWFGQIMDAVPGAWPTVFTLIVIMILSRFLLGPILGSMFNPSGSSDKSKKKGSKSSKTSKGKGSGSSSSSKKKG